MMEEYLAQIVRFVARRAVAKAHQLDRLAKRVQIVRCGPEACAQGGVVREANIGEQVALPPQEISRGRTNRLWADIDGRDFELGAEPQLRCGRHSEALEQFVAMLANR